PFTGRETVLDALLIAGGLNDRASRRHIILSRPSHPADCRTVLPVCYDQIVQLGDTTTNYQIMPGDRIFVPSRSAWDDCRGRKKSAGHPGAGWPAGPMFPSCGECGSGMISPAAAATGPRSSEAP